MLAHWLVEMMAMTALMVGGATKVQSNVDSEVAALAVAGHRLVDNGAGGPLLTVLLTGQAACSQLNAGGFAGMLVMLARADGLAPDAGDYVILPAQEDAPLGICPADVPRCGWGMYRGNVGDLAATAGHVHLDAVQAGVLRGSLDSAFDVPGAVRGTFESEDCNAPLAR